MPSEGYRQQIDKAGDLAAGYSSQISGSAYITNRLIRMADSKLSQNPAFTICGMLMYLLLKTIAFGGVATGNMKA